MSNVLILWRQRLLRDYRQLLLWVIGIALMAYVAFVGVGQTYGTEADRAAILSTAATQPSLLMLRGLPSGTSEGAFMAFLILPWLALLAGMMSTFLAVRHTRTEEETGRADLVSATPASRTAPLLATILHGARVNLVLGVLVAAVFLGTGSESAGSWIAGAATAATGLVFIGVGLVAAQLMRTSRGANSLATWTLIVTLLLAGIGNALGTLSTDGLRITSSGLTWLSPVGWAENTRPFSDNLLWPVLLALGVTAALITAAVIMQAVRDTGESFVAQRRGPAAAGVALSSPLGLVWRLTRGAVIGWAIGGLVVGAMSTSLASVVEQLGDQTEAVTQALQQMSGSDQIEQATVLVFFTMLGVLAACCAVQVIARARQEETHGTAEAVLATATGRVRWLAGYVVIAGVGVTLIALAGVGGAALGLLGQNGSMNLMRDVWIAAGGQVAAGGVFLATTAVVFVLLPRLTIPIGWGIVLLATTFGMFGPIFGAPDWLVQLAPIAITPEPTATGIDPRGFWWMLLALIGGVSAALTLMNRRELATGA